MSSVVVLVRNNVFWIKQVLTIAARASVGLVRPERIDKLDKELTQVIEYFDRAVNVDALRLAKETGTYSLSLLVHAE